MTGADVTPLRLMLARACAWALLVAGWIGIGSLALQYTVSVDVGFALVAVWLFTLGAAATVATRGDLQRATRALVLCAGAGVTAIGLVWSVRGGGLGGIAMSLLGWAIVTSLASGVVRILRMEQAVLPRPPVAPASLGALGAGLTLGDIGDAPALALRLAVFVGVVAAVLVLLQCRSGDRPFRPGCRAGLFDCSLPAWPAGAWRDLLQWPTLLAGLAMLPMMAALPLMAAWCQAQAIAPQNMVLLHLAAMFLPAWMLGGAIAGWSPRRLAAVCALLLACGTVFAVAADAPFDLLGLAITHGAAWGIAWSGQLWAPERRGQQGVSPLHAAAGYALLTLIFGLIVGHYGAQGVIAMHAAIGITAVLAWSLAMTMLLVRRRAA